METVTLIAQLWLLVGVVSCLWAAPLILHEMKSTRDRLILSLITIIAWPLMLLMWWENASAALK